MADKTLQFQDDLVLPAGVEPAAALRGFRGDLHWIHAREGHNGKAYWPGGDSGVTLDPGIDLGYVSPSLFASAYQAVLTPAQLTAARQVLGTKGPTAKAALMASAVLQSIRISRTQATAIFPYVAQPFWEAIIRRFPSVPAPDTLPAVHTVMLSLAYNRGAKNRALEVLREPLARKDWATVAELVGAMQQDHPLVGIRTRRRLEAELILAALA